MTALAISDYLEQTPRSREDAAIDTARKALQAIARSSSDIGSQDQALTALLRLRTDPEPVEVARISLRRLSAVSADERSRKGAAEAMTRLEILVGAAP